MVMVAKAFSNSDTRCSTFILGMKGGIGDVEEVE